MVLKKGVAFILNWFQMKKFLGIQDFYIKTKKGRIGQNEKNLSTKEETKK